MDSYKTAPCGLELLLLMDKIYVVWILVTVPNQSRVDLMKIVQRYPYTIQP